jgi:tRNA(Arg) A34 adenosine deaminase TadA
MYVVAHGSEKVIQSHPQLTKGKKNPQGETSALHNSGRLPASAYKGATMYTTLSPCDMCTGACLLYGITRVVIGENKTFLGGEAYLVSNNPRPGHSSQLFAA